MGCNGRKKKESITPLVPQLGAKSRFSPKNLWRTLNWWHNLTLACIYGANYVSIRRGCWLGTPMCHGPAISETKRTCGLLFCTKKPRKFFLTKKLLPRPQGSTCQRLKNNWKNGTCKDSNRCPVAHSCARLTAWARTNSCTNWMLPLYILWILCGLQSLQPILHCSFTNL